MDDLLNNSALILGSGVFGSLLTLLFTRYDSDKKVITEHVTKERQVWRDKIRSLVIEVTDAYQLKNWDALQGIQSQFHVLINPYDNDDQKIIEALQSIRLGRVQCEKSLSKFNRLVSKLLKHDWERVKSETAFFVTARGLFLASVTLFVMSSILIYVLDFFNVTNGLAVMGGSVVFVFCLPVLYERILTCINKYVFPKCVNFNKLISWLKNTPYRDGLAIECTTHIINIANNNNSEKYVVSICKT